ncbi:VOC family protein [Streptomyces sp. NPDC052676]|uniref:VOC family protein n=1 Tax=Streptomyces sp. NPDC052676 TaxID=3154953 RepID=UPI00342069B7
MSTAPDTSLTPVPGTRPPAHRITVAVPDVGEATAFLAELTGPSTVHRAGEAGVVSFSSGVEVRLVPTAPADTPDTPPRLVDIGTNHLCLRVGDIEAAVAHLEKLPGADVLGDIVTIPEGPIRGNRWIYFRSPWGTLFELQQWPDTPGYADITTERLHHDQRPADDAPLPTLLGLDHTGYSVRNLDATVDHLVTHHRARLVLRTEIAADRAFMQRQFDLDVEGTSRMAMLVVDDALNLELFEHGVPDRQPPRSLDRLGGNLLELHATPQPAPTAHHAPFGLTLPGPVTT